MPKWNPPVEYSYAAALVQARKLFGSVARCRFEGKRPKGERYRVGLDFTEDGVPLFAVIATGANWTEAVSLARTRWEEFMEQQRQSAADAEKTKGIGAK